MRKPKYRLSPNEVERLVKEDTERRRKLRILQVREQAKANAAKIRNDVRNEKNRLLNNLALELEEQLNAEKDEKIRKLEEKYEETLRTVGEGHKEVHLHGDGQNRALSLKQKKEAELIAQERFNVALNKEKKDIEEKEFKENSHIYARRAALDVERDRASKVASMPPPPPDISVDLEKSQKKAIPMVDMKAFATTHYHIPEYQVVRAEVEEQSLYDAKAVAEETDLKLKQDLQERRRALHAQAERARIRGNQALEKEILKHDYGDMLKDLSLLQRQDRRRRQAQVADLPKQVFIPAERCVDERRDRQNEMQQRFHQLYMDDHGLDSELHSTDLSDYASGLGSAGESSLDAHASLVAGRMSPSRLQPSFRPANDSNQSNQNTQPNSVLKQLLNKIKEQRSASTTTSGQVTGRSQPPEPGSKSQVTGPESSRDRAAWQSAPSIVQDHSQQSPTQPISKESHPTSLPTTPKPSMPAANFPPEPTLSDCEALINNERLIEQLKERIERIESEKTRLNQHFQNQRTRFAQNSQASPSPLKSDMAESTLREVDISCDNITHNSSTGVYSPTSKQITMEGQPDTLSPSDLASAAANLRPLAGILKGVKNAQYELMTSNGFPPLPDMCTQNNLAGDADSEGEAGFSGEDCTKDLVGILKGQGLDSKANKNAHTISTKTQPAAHPALPPSSMNPSLLTEPSPQAQWLGTHQRNSQETPDDPGARVRAYHASAQHRHQQLAPDTVHRVRQYQQSLLDTDSHRRQMLADIRADIERRRIQLMESQASSLSKASQNLYQGLTGQSVPERAGEPLAQVRGHESSSVPQFDPKTWEPIKPIQAVDQPDLVAKNDEKDEELAFPSKNFDIGDMHVLNKPSNTNTNNNKDTVCKSLNFDDPVHSGGQSPVVSWKGVLDETGVSSIAPGDESHITSSESRGSPALRSSSHLEISSASNASITGSSSLNGSALVARAEESRQGFELRQQELREQLAEIAQQKDNILQRYAASHGYQIHNDQTGDGCQPGQGSAEGYREQQELVRLKLAVVNAQLSAEGSTRPGLRKPEHNSRRSSSGSGGSVPSAESYLEEISFQRLISPSQAPVMPASAFTRTTVSTDFFPMAKTEPENNGKLQTWASILSSSSNSSFDSHEGKRLDDSTLSKSSREGEVDTDGRGQESPPGNLDIRGTQKTPEPEEQRPGQEKDNRSLSSIPPGAWAHVLTEHRPHELSTILEVDTPSSSARIVTSGLPAARGSQYSSSSNQSLSSSAQDLAPVGQEASTRARRSLDFSDTQLAQSHNPMWPISDMSSSEDLWKTPMPDLVELTPLKASPQEEGGDGDEQDMSSFQLSGYSDYLRAGHEVKGGAGVDSANVADASGHLTSLLSMSLNEVSISSADENNSSM